MRRVLIYILLLFSFSASLLAEEVAAPHMKGQVVQMTGSFLEQLQERDSVLIADQVRYGFGLQQVEEGTRFGFAQIEDTLMTNIRIVENWRMDTLKVKKQKMNILLQAVSWQCVIQECLLICKMNQEKFKFSHIKKIWM